MTALYFAPGMVVGLILGWFLIRPVNAFLGVFFRAFNRGFDRMTAGYGKSIGTSLRSNKVVLVGGSTRTPMVSRLLEERLKQPTHQEVKILHGLARQLLWAAGQMKRSETNDGDEG